ncbi:DUF2975 domain-containing protein [Spirosoma linguale]|uniref:DUF2975 domain-containing protein n=1 Tax=Spirosoma linguale (strain ATCC 33905 / DSM 74 / LMG 10896 / Claus 1) TaxID=504472 RepID=D2QKH4_SPILD|nr:hypothetical protein Slin_2989 [Spirosoma linguale DSM 74]
MHTSYLRTLKRIVAFIYYASLFLIVGGALVLAYTYFGPLKHLTFYINVPIRLGEEVVYGDRGFVFTTHSSYSSWLNFDCFDRSMFNEDAGLYWKNVICIFFDTSTIALMLRQVKLIMDTVGTIHVFSTANVARIRVLGILLIINNFDELLSWLLIKNDVIALLQKHHATYTLGSYGLPALLSSSFFIGFLLFGLAEVFRSGLYLKEEQELTV